MQISAVIITFNEERNIGRCLASLQGVVDEIIVVDSFSTDGTKAICEQYGVSFSTNVFEGHIQQKNFAMHCATYDWVLSLDADEALSDELQSSIQTIKEQAKFQAYQMNRLTNYCGEWIHHCGWYPDAKVRLWDRRIGHWGGRNPHDKVIVQDGIETGRLKGDMFHYSCYTIFQHIDQIQKFSGIAAKSAYEDGIRSNLLMHIILGPFYTFIKKYILQGGYRDGYFGFMISMNTAFSKFLKYTKLRELERSKK